MSDDLVSYLSNCWGGTYDGFDGSVKLNFSDPIDIVSALTTSIRFEILGFTAFAVVFGAFISDLVLMS